MLHQFIVDNIEYVLIVILAAQALILYGQSRIYDWARAMFLEIVDFMMSTNNISKIHQQKITDLETKLKSK